jgi:hypothetical protein
MATAYRLHFWMIVAMPALWYAKGGVKAAEIKT